MAKTEPDVPAQGTSSVAMNAMFKKFGKEAPRQGKIHHMKDAIEKPTKASKSKSNKGYKSKHTAKHIPEHPLAGAFAGKIDLFSPTTLSPL